MQVSHLFIIGFASFLFTMVFVFIFNIFYTLAYTINPYFAFKKYIKLYKKGLLSKQTQTGGKLIVSAFFHFYLKIYKIENISLDSQEKYYCKFLHQGTVFEFRYNYKERKVENFLSSKAFARNVQLEEFEKSINEHVFEIIEKYMKNKMKSDQIQTVNNYMNEKKYVHHQNNSSPIHYKAILVGDSVHETILSKINDINDLASELQKNISSLGRNELNDSSELINELLPAIINDYQKSEDKEKETLEIKNILSNTIEKMYVWLHSAKYISELSYEHKKRRIKELIK